jgi:hypothetical protein
MIDLHRERTQRRAELPTETRAYLSELDMRTSSKSTLPDSATRRTMICQGSYEGLGG